MKKLLLGMVLCATPMLALADASTDDYRVLDRIAAQGDETLSYAELIQQHKLTGFSLTVVDDFQIVYSTTAGNKEAGKSSPVNTNTAFSTASISKPVTATIATMLAEQGKLDLDKPVSQYLKRWTLPENALTKQQPVTLRHLLTHTAGTTQGGFADFYLGDEIPTLIDSLNGKLPRYDRPIEVKTVPGTAWQYSGGGYVIAQLVMEDVTGKSLAEMARDMIFEPLGMQHTTMFQHGQAGFLSDVAKVHDENQQVIKTGIPICPQIAPSGMWSTADDMARFVIDFQKALAGKPSRVISPWVAEQTTHIYTVDVVGGWGLGWMRTQSDGNLEWFSHGGSNTGTGGHVLATMQGGKAILVFGNGPNPARIPVINIVKQHIVDVLGWKEELTPAVETPSSKLLVEMQGRYQSRFDDVVTINKQQGRLMVSGWDMGWTGTTLGEAFVYAGDGKFALDQLNSLVNVQINPVDNQPYLTLYRKGTDFVTYEMRKLAEGEQLPFEVAKQGSYEQTLQAYQAWKKRFPDASLLSPRAINYAGYRALGQQDFSTALKLLRVQTAFYPDNANAWDSLAEAYKKSGNTTKAKQFYLKSLELNPDNAHAVAMLEELRESS